MEIRARNVNVAISEALWKLKITGVKEDSRNGPVIAFPEPVMTTYERPQERVLFWGERDANPIFHLMESIWMMAGRRDVAFPEMFNSRIGQYSDDGAVFNAAYGFRWRTHFGNQLYTLIELLKKDHSTRQAVLQIWDSEDLDKVTKDKACNLACLFEIRRGILNMTVLNRSNDLWYGCYGANAVHFSFLMEFVATAVGVPMGVYRQFSHNLHLYGDHLYPASKHLENPPDPSDYDAYAQGVTPYPIMNYPNPDYFIWDCEVFCENPFRGGYYHNSFFHDVAHPMAMVSKVRKDKTGDGMYWASRIHAQDWRIAVEDWIERRESAKLAKQK